MFAKNWPYSLHTLGFIKLQIEDTTLGTPDIFFYSIKVLPILHNIIHENDPKTCLPPITFKHIAKERNKKLTPTSKWPY